MVNKLHIDHIKPVQGGGTNDPANLMPACASCNNYKMSWSLDDFRDNIASQVRRARTYSVNFRLAEKYGLIQTLIKPIVFYFERERPAAKCEVKK